jgi:endonuclease/exonuclease/phosphatase family metal-dependent hydrolase
MTYNIHKGIGGVDRRYRLERIIETVSFHEPDIVLLQEVADGVPRWHRHRQVDLLADTLGFRHRVFQPNAKLREGVYGNAILSRFSLSDIHDIELTVPLKKRRRGLAVRCHVSLNRHLRSLLIFNFHLGLAGFERVIQIRRFLSNDALVHTHRRTAVIAAGDFNDVWGTLGKRLLEPAGFRVASGLLKTFPAFHPVRPLDRIYFRGDLRLLRYFHPRSLVAKRASDHLPVIADFEIP